MHVDWYVCRLTINSTYFQIGFRFACPFTELSIINQKLLSYLTINIFNDYYGGNEQNHDIYIRNDNDAVCQ